MYQNSIWFMFAVITLNFLNSGPSASQTSANGLKFRTDGHDAAAFGQAQNYPTCKAFAYITKQRCRIGAFSQYDTLLRSRKIRAPKKASQLKCGKSEPNISYRYAGHQNTLDDYLNKHPVTGFLIARDDTILVERYQYSRRDTHRFTSFSMAKTIIGMLIGIAMKDGAINSINDLAQIYVPKLKGTEYGLTPIKALLQMSSGVEFRENYAAGDDIRKLGRLLFGHKRLDNVNALKRFNNRCRSSGQKFSYSSAETLVLGLVLSRATGQSISAYAQKKLWKPLGGEADASWVINKSGQEITFAYFNARLRDWARLGLMLANNGTWNGKNIIPNKWILDATSIGTGDGKLKNVDLAHNVGYGYQTWLLPGNRGYFAMLGSFGQRVFIDPKSRLVLVQTAAYSKNSVSYGELLVLWSAILLQLQ